MIRSFRSVITVSIVGTVFMACGPSDPNAPWRRMQNGGPCENVRVVNQPAIEGKSCLHRDHAATESHVRMHRGAPVLTYNCLCLP